MNQRLYKNEWMTVKKGWVNDYIRLNKSMTIKGSINQCL